MKILNIPKELYKSIHHLLGAMEIVAEQFGHSKEQAKRIFRLLPYDLKNAPAFQSTLNNKWYYEYGEPYTRPNSDQIIYGTDQCPLVERLYIGMIAIDRYLSNSQLIKFLERLSIKSKHLETLMEAAPLTLLSDSKNIEHDIEGYGVGKKKIDFLIETEESPPILLEVKCRIKELIYKFAEETPSDPHTLFPSTYEKFKENDPKIYLQGVWLHSSFKYHLSELKSVFDSINPQKLHFTILACWNIQAFILSRDNEIEKILKSVFSFPNNDSIVIKD